VLHLNLPWNFSADAEDVCSYAIEARIMRDIPWDIPHCAANAQIALMIGKSNLQKTTNIQQIN
jgi:hypothetical protein